jgi:hypothetical protein
MTDQLIRAFLAHGVIGLVAALFIYLYIRELTEHQKTRDAATKKLEAVGKEHAAEIKTLHSELAAEKTTLLLQSAAQERTFFEQMNDLREAHAMRERASLQTIEFFAKAEVEAVEELGRIAQALRKAYERLRR